MECAAALSDIEIASVIGAINEGGSETVGSFLAVFVLASVLYPDAVSEAQKELDSVVGLSRLPCFSDREELPYTRAFIKEIQRWHPLVPLGIPRVADRDERLAGYHIPKGSIILPNHWSMHLDGDTFNQPEEFRPERWLLGENLPLRAFGFGRRICPGMHIAEDILFIAVSRLLWAFNFQTGSGSEPAAAVRPYRMEQTMIAAPLPFDAALTVRSTRYREIICQQWSVERSREIESGWPSPIAADVS
jgi:cytochrome P450